MSIEKAVEALRSYPERASDDFREQLRMGQSAMSGEFVRQPAISLGVDRSRELAPVVRPSLLRVVART